MDEVQRKLFGVSSIGMRSCWRSEQAVDRCCERASLLEHFNGIGSGRVWWDMGSLWSVRCVRHKDIGGGHKQCARQSSSNGDDVGLT